MQSFGSNLNILVIDTSTEVCVVGLLSNNNVYTRNITGPKEHSKYILNFIDDLLKQNELSFADIDVIGFGRGPGSFTGVRVSASVVQALSFVTKAKIYSISSLHAIAQTAYKKNSNKFILATIDARKSEVYYGLYQASSANLVIPLTKDLLSKPSNLLFSDNYDCWGTNNKVIVVVGTGLHYDDFAIEQSYSIKYGLNDVVFRRVEGIQSPSVESLLDITISMHNDGSKDSRVEELLPTYVRDNIAF